MSDNKFYITTTLPYVNADPHIGFALEIVQADMIARYHSLKGEEVFFNTGTDEHGSKINEKANKEGKDVKDYVDYYAAKFRELKDTLGLFDDLKFIRTTDEKHIKAAQEFWKRCEANGDIYKKNYKTKYCVGCELEKTDSELVNGKCPLHPDRELEIIEEENYFFRYSKYGEKLLELYKKQPNLVVPDFRFNEIKKFVERGLEDFSISRLKSKMSWGIEVPNDPEHVMYVWFDALINYISTLDWPENEPNFKDFWPGIQVAGKDQVRMQSAMWQAMLLSAGLPPSKQIYIHGFINIDGQKMSKSVGNVVNPIELVNEFGVDTLRYYLLREINPYEDSDFTLEKMKTAYNANLANGIGNLTSRVLKMATVYGVSFDGINDSREDLLNSLEEDVNKYNFNGAMDKIWYKISELDSYIQKNEPYKKIKVDEIGAKSDVVYLLKGLASIAYALKIALPTTANKIEECLVEKKMPESSLFTRKD